VRRIAFARRGQRHLYLKDWQFPFEAGQEETVEAILAWCKDTLARCPRPFGIDHFDFAVAVSCEGRPRSLSYKKLRPGALYAASFARDLAAVLPRKGWDEAQSAAVYISAALFSWGAAAHEALPASP
jgi:hypothetical protein